MNRKEDIKKIWKECFGDPQDYIDMYFSRVYSERDALTLEKGGRIVSSLLLQPYSMQFHRTDVTVGYIAGAATRRNARGNGYMSELMLTALDTAAERGYMACALIPAHDWLYDFYNRFDFSTVFYVDPQRFTSLHRFAAGGFYTPVDDPYDSKVFEAFRSFEAARPCTILHSQHDFLNILDDLAHDGGKFIAIEDEEGRIAAMGWAAPTDGRLIVKELLGLDEEARETVLSHFRTYFPDVPVTVMAPAGSDGRKLYPRGMIRIVNTPLCLGIVAAANPSLSLRMKITDTIMPRNCHIYIITGGVCSIDDEYEGTLDFDITADTFNRLVFSSARIGDITGFPSQRPHISLMLD